MTFLQLTLTLIAESFKLLWASLFGYKYNNLITIKLNRYGWYITNNQGQYLGRDLIWNELKSFTMFEHVEHFQTVGEAIGLLRLHGIKG